MKTVSASFTHLGPPARFCKPPSPFSKGSPPRPGTILPLHSSPNGHLGWQGDPPPHPRPDSASGQGPRSGPYPPASQARRRPETRAIVATSNVPPTPQLAESPTKTPPRTPSSHTASSDSRRHRHLGTLSPCTGAAPGAETHPPPKPRGNRGAAISFFQLVSLLCIRTHSNCER